ncbi:MAG: DUF6491 family protein [Gammaproteobacteria bacterium]|nr:DUF6491 family protein [Gammaproteobacteria bacterium]
MRAASLIRIWALAAAAVVLAACAAPEERDPVREDAPIRDFIDVNELAEVRVIRTLDQLSSREVNDYYVIVSTRREDYLLEYFSRCLPNYDGRVEPDVRRDSRALYPGADTYRGCRIKTIYALEPGQADELHEIGKATSR